MMSYEVVLLVRVITKFHLPSNIHTIAQTKKKKNHFISRTKHITRNIMFSKNTVLAAILASVAVVNNVDAFGVHVSRLECTLCVFHDENRSMMSVR